MEEILASIRRIIADDQALPLSPRTSGQPRTAATQLEADAAAATARAARMAYDAGSAGRRPASRTASNEEWQNRPGQAEDTEAVNFEAEAAFAKEAAEAPYSRSSYHEADMLRHDDEVSDTLLEGESHSSVASSLQALTATLFMQNTGVVESGIRDLLKPSLKEWMDDNLPGIVERIVRAEIERVARGTRG